MRVTNKWNLPDTIVRAVTKSDALYDRGPVDISCTGLIDSPQIRLLKKQHYPELEVDVSDEVWKLFGSAVHHILQLGAGTNQTVEERLYGTIDGWTFSGAMDLQSTTSGIEIDDYKVTSVYKTQMDNDDWVKQLNIYRWLVEINKKLPVTKLSIIAILRDWQRTQSYAPDYPKAPIIRVDIPLWTMAEAEAYIRERVRAHRHAVMMADLGMDLPPCSVEDRWGRGGKWRIMKAGAKRATRSCDSEAEAVEVLATLGPGYEILPASYKFIRCEGNYCGVSAWCAQNRVGEAEPTTQVGDA